MSNKDKKQAAMALIAFAILSFVSALFFNVTTGGQISEVLSPEGGIVGPISIEKDRTVYQITVAQDIRSNGAWNQVEGSVLDEQKNHLFSFGEEFWKEAGYDDGGAWSESKTDYTIKVLLQRGTYYLGFEAEQVNQVTGSIQIIGKQKGGSSVPLFTAGVIALILGVILYQMAAASSASPLKTYTGRRY